MFPLPVAHRLSARGTVTAMFGGVMALLGACRSGPSEEASDELPVEEASWTYVGDEVCGSCHDDTYLSYHETGMGKSVSVFDPETAPERFGSDGRSPVVCADDGFCYQAYVRGDSLYQREFREDGLGEERVFAASHVVGSGNATRSYFMSVKADSGAYVTEMPLTWYVERGIWDLSPGYDVSNSRFERPIVQECMTCHNGFPGFEVSQNYYTEIPIGITCERCHGPGSEHVETFLATAAPDSTFIVNPASLSPQLQLDVCQQCHLTGTTIFREGEDPTTYRPGQPLEVHRTVFVTEESLNDPDAFGIASHAERLKKSACYVESVDTPNPMTCTTCHDPHRPIAQTPEEHFRNACLTCHAGEQDAGGHADVCLRPDVASMAEAITGDCVSCHMRTAGTSDIPHVEFTDHWIRRRPPPSTPGRALNPDRYKRVEPYELVNMMNGSASTDLEAGMAYYHLYETAHPLEDYLPRVVERIERGLAAGADRTDARVILGQALLEMGEVPRARETLEAAVERDGDDPFALYWLGVALQRSGRSADAVEPLERAVQEAPHLTEARTKLGNVLVETGRAEEGIAMIREALRRDPERFPGAWNDLGLFLLQQGMLNEAIPALRRAVALDPLMVIARVNLGTALLANEQFEEAEAEFRTALEQSPDMPPALGNLAVIQMQRGDTTGARRSLERLLELSPGDARARALLDEIDSQ